MAKIWALHDPNLNLLGNRGQECYGTTTLKQIGQKSSEQAAQKQRTEELQ